MDWMVFDDEGDAENLNMVTPEEYLEEHEYYQQFHPKWDDTFSWIMMLPETEERI